MSDHGPYSDSYQRPLWLHPQLKGQKAPKLEGIVGIQYSVERILSLGKQVSSYPRYCAQASCRVRLSCCCFALRRSNSP
jgi:hypothetical protein